MTNLPRKSKLAVFIENDFILRSYMETSVLESLARNYSVEVVLTYEADLNNLEQRKSLEFASIKKNPILQMIQTVFSIAYWYRKQEESNSLRIRILTLKHSRRVFYSSKKSRDFPSFTIVLGFLFAKTNMKIRSSLLALAAGSYRKFLLKSKPDLIVCVTSGSATSNSDVLALVGKEFIIPVLTVIENWDNLTTKAVFNVQPDFLGVWGEKDKRTAAQLHGFMASSIMLLGSPRVSQLIQARPTRPRMDGGILFAGGCIDIECDLEWLHTVQVVAARQKVPVVYVPHPSNYNSLAELIDSGQTEVSGIIPAQIFDLITHGVKKRYPNLGFYESVFQNTSITVSPYSTLLLESLLFGVTAVGIDFQDPKNTVSGWASEELEHFAGLDYFNDYHRVTTTQQLTALLYERLEVLKGDRKPNEHSQNEQISNPFYDSSVSFEAKLQEACELILLKNKSLNQEKS
jgi:hypothetical protein